jgi:hypothetical protein
MRSAYVIKIDLNTKLIFTDLEDNRLSINGLDNVTKKLKGNRDNIFICENLTKHRYDMLKRLNTHRINNKVHSYWTHDGSIIVKKSEHSGTKIVRNLEDVDRLALDSLN